MAIDLKATTPALTAADLTGTWRGGGQETLGSDGRVLKPLSGDAPPAYIMYTAAGEVMVLSTGQHGLDADGAATLDLDRLSDEQQARITRTTVAYYGTFEIDRGVITHHLVVGLVPAWAGQSRIRYAVLDGDDLTFTTPPDKAGNIARIHWHRVRRPG